MPALSNYRHLSTASAAWLAVLVVSAAPANGQLRGGSDPTTIEDPLPYGQQPVDYLGPETSNPAAKLNAGLQSGGMELRFEEKHGYLRSLLKALDVPVESQVLVFSKTALNPKLVSPQNPRAVYFNDTAAVGWVPGAASLEVAALDDQKGPVFYTLHQNDEQPARLLRERRCLACHAGTTTLQVPGLMVRSFLTDETGKPLSGYSRITHATDFSKRWGGWYVTGNFGRLKHWGREPARVGDKEPARVGDKEPARLGDKEPARVGPDRGHRPRLSRGNDATNPRPFFDVSRYVSPHSDIVAHLVLEHQAHGLNLLTRVNHEARLNRRSDAEERLVRYLLFADEAPLAGPVSGTAGYRPWFEKQGPRDSRGRSLRQFDLKTRLFRYRLSYLIYSPLFEGLPAEVKSRLYGRLWEILSGRDDSAEFRIPRQERAAIVEIVRQTKDHLPDYWQRALP